jgi:hypothetical protein
VTLFMLGYTTGVVVVLGSFALIIVRACAGCGR